MRVVANLGTMFTDVPILQRYEKAAKIGFKLVENPFPYSVEASELKSAADKFNLKHILINAPCGNVDIGDRGIAASKNHLKDFEKSILKAIQYAKILECPKIHIMAGALEGTSKNAKILFDIFHIQQIHGQISPFLKKYVDRIGHIQVAQVPFRHEPDSKGELNYLYIFELMKTVNDNWTIGCEYYNTTEDQNSVQWVKDFGLDF
uniref:Xylose isomerase-like TIM barrel domain-containing protein n=1 Tax=Panagrolaimus superbus TaxID=310955 RepID=A0A914YYM7_9BILA